MYNQNRSCEFRNFDSKVSVHRRLLFRMYLLHWIQPVIVFPEQLNSVACPNSFTWSLEQQV